MSGTDITLTITYKTEEQLLLSGEKKLGKDVLLQRSLNAGWNSVGAADPENTLAQGTDLALNIDTSDTVFGSNQNIDKLIDFTGNANSAAVAFDKTSTIGYTFRNRGSADKSFNIINPRETRGYIVHTTKGGVSMSGTQKSIPAAE
ncbi:MAG: hypothetical protein COZ88_01705 [Candidatus Nealsonbacteria bacterium CG_4_8_14_3_um_filter_34_13]|nr:MAG: hypothetical protein COZ88_01705 [Candidatus Nealsonbacteria bacterium CG_4_8_14_3_um_filter_34_13]